MNDELQKVVSGIGPKIKALRAENGLSLQAAATMADVSAATIHKIEQGDMVPTITTLLKIAAALQRPIAYFVEEQEHPPPTAVIRPEERPEIYTSHSGIQLAGITGPYDEFLVAAAFATVRPHASSGSRPIADPSHDYRLRYPGLHGYVRTTRPNRPRGVREAGDQPPSGRVV